MSETAMLPAVDEIALEAIAQHSTSIQAIARQIIALAGSTAKATDLAQQAVNMVTNMQADVTGLKSQVSEIEIRIKQRITMDDQQAGILYQAVHDKARWAVQNFPEEDYKTHITRLWTKIKQDLVVNKYSRILDKDFNYAIQAVRSYPGHGRNWQVA